ncbi:hypothetical protein [Virgibacillus litoralis]|uniref:Uncharacterized protein n=1 Tax=Virgibacillus litoralis TaxID=578221 RepID=A0ABS4HG01_9BACI|nr:hypothetical protein [Virgibacillus litoralis]MBP1949352.1 hypothetical protein [Virgibacillus litoralis]
MDEYELECQLISFCSINDKETRYNEIKNDVYKDNRILDILSSLVAHEQNPDEKQNAIDHLDLLTEYQSKGIHALDFFTSVYEIEHSFIKLAFGFENFSKRKEYLLSVPFLFEKRSINIITKKINREEYLNTNIASKLYRNLLKACRVIGIERAFNEFSTPEKRFVDAVNSLMNRETIPELALFLYDHKKIISSPQIRNVFHYLQAQYELDSNKREKIKALWEFLSPYQDNQGLIWYWE